jgi:dTDP-4-dehydrorhamnose reductase
MRITIFGATGLLGKALMQQWAGEEVTGLGSHEADIRNPQDVAEAIRRTRPEWVVLAAAYTDVDGCEKNRELAFDVNCQGAVNVARAAQECASRLLLLSSDYVFDGTKTAPYETGDPRAPRSVYGRSKADAEVAVTQLMPDCCIVRTSWLFGAGGRCFPDTILKLAATRDVIDVVNDQRGSPTYAVDLARAMYQLLQQKAKGLVHVTNRGQCTWFEFAREVLASAGRATVVRPVSSDTMVRPADRPKYSVLSPKSLEPYGIVLPSWQDALRLYLDVRKHGPQLSMR